MTRTTDVSTGLIGETVVAAWRPLPLGDPDPLAPPCHTDRLVARLYLTGMAQSATLPAPLFGFYATTDGLIAEFGDADTVEVQANDTTYLLLHTDSLPANLHTGVAIGGNGFGALPFVGSQYLMQGTLDGQAFSFAFEIDAAQDYTGTLVESSVPIEQLTVDYTPASGSLGGLWAERVDSALTFTDAGGTTVTKNGAGAYEFSSPSTLDGLDPAAGDYDLGGHLLTGLGAPVSANDAARKAWVETEIDAALTGLSWKQACWVATAAPIDLASAPALIDGITMVAANGLSSRRVLVKDQASDTENGIYEWVNVGVPMVRTDDADGPQELRGASVFIVGGATLGDTQWSQSKPANTVGSSDIVWKQIGALVSYGAQNGGHLGLSGNEFYLIDGPGSGVDADTVDGVHAVSLARLDATRNNTAHQNATRDTSEAFRQLIYASDTNRYVLERWAGVSTWELAPSDDSDGSYVAAQNLRFSWASAQWTIGTGKIWHAENDGAGSGLDADLIGGRKITSSDTAPSTPSTGDIWLDTTP